MTKIKFSALVSDMNGAHNGSVHSANAYGSYMKIKSSPNQHISKTQSSSKIKFGRISQTWKSLTEAQRTQWNLMAPEFVHMDVFGDQQDLTGFNLYMRLNKNISLFSGVLLTTPPSPKLIRAPLVFTAAFTTGGGGTARYTLTGGLAGQNIAVAESSIPVSLGKAFDEKLLRVVLSNAATYISIINNIVAYRTATGSSPKLGTKIFSRARIIDLQTGIMSLPKHFSHETIL
jgi:hypothetical protein